MAGAQPRRGTVWWIDAHHGGEEYALAEDLPKEHLPLQRGETGWIIIDDAFGVTLALSWLPKPVGDTYLTRGPQNSDFLDITFIPRAMVERIEYLAPE